MIMNVNDVFPTNEQAAKAHLLNTQRDEVFFSRECKNGFHVLSVSGTADTAFKIVAVRHPVTRQFVVFPSRCVANRYCDILNSQGW